MLRVEVSEHWYAKSLEYVVNIEYGADHLSKIEEYSIPFDSFGSKMNEKEEMRR